MLQSMKFILHRQTHKHTTRCLCTCTNAAV